MRARLVIVGGKANKAQVIVNLPCVIGRSRQADLTVAHPMISRRHCELHYEGGVVRVRDLQSLNGTHAGGEKVNEADLPPDAEFTIGPITFRVEYQPASDVIDLGPNPGSDSAPPSSATIGISMPAPPSTVEFLGPADEDLSDASSPGSDPANAIPVDEELPVIAPPSGDLPDIEAWVAAVGGRSRLSSPRRP
jgi:predicted component of type VI protein secretion system